MDEVVDTVDPTTAPQAETPATPVNTPPAVTQGDVAVGHDHGLDQDGTTEL